MKLPLNCSVEYIDTFLSISESKALYNELIEVYRIHELKTKITTSTGEIYSNYGKLMFLDKTLYESNKLPEVLWGKSMIWSTKLNEIKRRVEKIVNRTFHVCVCIYYPDGNSGVDFHSDYVAFGDINLIPSLSIGEGREFQLREKETLNVYEITLTEGSLLIMGKDCQQNYEHCLPINPKYKNGRINLTFRTYGFN